MNVLFQESYVREVQDEGLPDPFRNVEMTAAEMEAWQTVAVMVA